MGFVEENGFVRWRLGGDRADDDGTSGKSRPHAGNGEVEALVD